MQDPKTFEIFKAAKLAIPKKTKVYLVGGAVRNALYFKFFNKKLPQRDYDILLVGDKVKFIKNLRAGGFIYGFIKRKHEVTLKKKKIPRPRHEFDDYVFLDIHLTDEKSILKNLKDNSNFTINEFALSLREIDAKNWHEKVISLPGAMRDLKTKKLRVNVIVHPANLFACLRFMSKGFKPPSKKEIKELLIALGSLEKWRYKRNIKKLFDYVGGENNAKKLVKKLGIKENVFDFDIIKKLRTQN